MLLSTNVPTKLALRSFGRHVPRCVLSNCSFTAQRPVPPITAIHLARKKLLICAVPQSDYGGASDDVIMCPCAEHPPFYVTTFGSPGRAHRGFKRTESYILFSASRRHYRVLPEDVGMNKIFTTPHHITPHRSGDHPFPVSEATRNHRGLRYVFPPLVFGKLFCSSILGLSNLRRAHASTHSPSTIGVALTPNFGA